MEELPLYLANSIIHWGISNGVNLTPLKIQKLLYLFSARFFALMNRPPFGVRFEKWTYGPVLRMLYDCLKRYGGQPVTDMIEDSKGGIHRVDIGNSVFSQAFDETMQQFGRKTARELVCITHGATVGHETAWAHAENAGDFLNDQFIREDGRVLFG